MQYAFMIFATRRGLKQKVPCMSASAAVEQRNLLVRQGWGVSISDHHGMPVSDARVEGTARAEAASMTT